MQLWPWVLVREGFATEQVVDPATRILVDAQVGIFRWCIAQCSHHTDGRTATVVGHHIQTARTVTGDAERSTEDQVIGQYRREASRDADIFVGHFYPTVCTSGVTHERTHTHVGTQVVGTGSGTGQGSLYIDTGHVDRISGLVDQVGHVTCPVVGERYILLQWREGLEEEWRWLGRNVRTAVYSQVGANHHRSELVLYGDQTPAAVASGRIRYFHLPRSTDLLATHIRAGSQWCIVGIEDGHDIIVVAAVRTAFEDIVSTHFRDAILIQGDLDIVVTDQLGHRIGIFQYLDVKLAGSHVASNVSHFVGHRPGAVVLAQLGSARWATRLDDHGIATDLVVNPQPWTWVLREGRTTEQAIHPGTWVLVDAQAAVRRWRGIEYVSNHTYKRIRSVVGHHVDTRSSSTRNGEVGHVERNVIVQVGREPCRYVDRRIGTLGPAGW